MPLRKLPLTLTQILAWADEHHQGTGKHPSSGSGPVFLAPHETWNAINLALGNGDRGLPGNDTLSLLLQRERGHRHRRRLPPLTEDAIVIWARAHQARTGRWPVLRSGPVEGVPGEVWATIDHALRVGSRGLPGGDSLSRLLTRTVGLGVRPRKQDQGEPGR